MGMLGQRPDRPALDRQEVMFSSWIAVGKPGVEDVALELRCGRGARVGGARGGLIFNQEREGKLTKAANSSLSCLISDSAAAINDAA
jgi:hypothetical protein